MFKILALVAVVAVVGLGLWRTFFSVGSQGGQEITANMPDQLEELWNETIAPDIPSIDALRSVKLDNSQIVIEQTLSSGSNYSRYLASYTSEGLKIYGLLMVPGGVRPESGWPAIVFNHGYIPPAQYKTTERYVAYQDAFARNGYVVFKPDYRGHGNSEGEPIGAYGSNAYSIDVLNALAAVKAYPDVDESKIGMWGHSLGGFLTLRAMVVSKDVKAGVIWAGVVGSYPEMLNNWRRPGITPFPSPSPTPGSRRWRQVLVDKYGTPEANPKFWDSLSATAYLNDISGPVQIHHGTADSSVPLEFSQNLESRLKAAGKTVQLYTYPGDDHNLSRNLSTALSRSVDFFDEYLK